MQRKLAIIIPYYKKFFFKETLQSIANQTCKDFVLYIGDDASPTPPNDIIDCFKDTISIEYHRYETNLGGKDLVAQWQRCISLSQGEEFIWLFSDDDSMSETCVEEFYECLNNNSDACFFRLKKTSVNRLKGRKRESTYKKGYAEFDQFLLDCLDMTQNSPTMPEFIFSRSLYDSVGIIKYPMAWGSDKITWMSYAFVARRLYNLGSVVYVSYSDVNISGTKNKEIMLIKNDIEISLSLYIKKLFANIEKCFPEIKINDIKESYVDKLLYKIIHVDFIKRFRYLKYVIPFICSYKCIRNIIVSLFKKTVEFT